jgi:hypothetical protein
MEITTISLPIPESSKRKETSKVAEELSKIDAAENVENILTKPIPQFQ